MILAQGWKDGRIHVLAISRCTNGMDGWQVYKGSFATGETAQNVTDWQCLNSSHDLVSLLYYPCFSEMASWVDGTKQVMNLQDTLLVIHKQCETIADYVKACAPVSLY